MSGYPNVFHSVKMSGEVSTTTNEQWTKAVKGYDLFKQIVQYFSTIASNILIQNIHSFHRIIFLDNCCGPATLTLELLPLIPNDLLQSSSIYLADYSSGMIEASKNILSSTDYSSLTIHYDVLDAQELSYADNTFTHIGCMFSVMMIKDYKKSYREMYRVLQSEGECVIGTWKSISNMNICNDFREYLWKSNGSIGDMPDHVVMSDNHCDSSLLQLDLLDSGFSKVEVVEYLTTFHLANSENLFFAYSTNPVFKDTFVEGNHTKWNEFLISNYGKRYYNNENDSIVVEAVANLAKCTK
eukprot:gene16839-22324_t